MNAGEQLFERGRVEGLRSVILVALSVRGLALSPAGCTRLAQCSDVAVLMNWVTRAATAATEEEIFAAVPAP